MTFLTAKEVVTIDIESAVNLVLKNNEKVVESLLSLPREKLELQLAARSWIPRLSIENKTAYENEEELGLILTNEVITDTKIKLESELPFIGTRMSVLGKVKYRKDLRISPGLRGDNLEGGYRVEVNQPIGRKLFSSAHRLDFNQAKKKFEVDEYNRLILKKEIMAEIFRRWSSMLIVKEKFSFAEEEVNRQSLIRDFNRILLRSGKITTIEYEQSEIDLINARHALQVVASEMESLKGDFFYFMGFPFDEFSKYELDLEKDFFLLEDRIFKDDEFDNLMEYTLINNVELKRAKSQREMSYYEMVRSKNQMAPTMDFYFFYDQTFHYNQSYHDNDMGGGVKFKYFFYNDEERRRLEAGKEQFRINILKENNLLERVKKDFSVYFNKRRQLAIEKELLEERIAVLKKRWERSRQLFRLGRLTLIELEQMRYQIKEFEVEYLNKFKERLDVFLELFLLTQYFPFYSDQTSRGSGSSLFNGNN